MDKTTVLKAFNTLFFTFLNDVISIFPENEQLTVAKTSFETIKKMNVTAIIKAWNHFVFLPYQAQIEAGDISFFIDKDYGNDITHLSNSDDIMQTIDKFRDPIRQMSEENKSHSMNYIKKLSQLSQMYSKF
jgi:hypothetical protein